MGIDLGVVFLRYPLTCFILPFTDLSLIISQSADIFVVSIGWLFFKFELNALEVPVVFVVFYDPQVPQGHSFLCHLKIHNS